MAKLRTVLLAGAVGALAAYFLDPGNGARRRAKARRLLDERFRSLSGGGPILEHAGDEYPSDETLAHKVESEVLGKGYVPKGKILVNVEEGVVVLRGELDKWGAIDRVEAETRKIPGVVDVRNLIHVPNSPAPNKASARAASDVASGSVDDAG
jgi:flavin-dependent dehydrogenase